MANPQLEDGYQKGLTDGRTEQIKILQRENKILKRKIQENSTLEEGT